MDYHQLIPEIPGNILDFAQFSVAIILHEIEGEDYILLERRSPHLDYQPRDISFPGGGIEPGETKEQAALRESSEELLLPEESFEVIGQLDGIQTPYGVELAVFLLRLHHEEKLTTWNEDEVEEVIYFPLKELLEEVPTYYVETAHVFGEDFPFHYIEGGKNYPFKTMKLPYYFYPLEKGCVWGLTARVMHYFGEKVKELKEKTSKGA